jgi:hypothetical protein
MTGGVIGSSANSGMNFWFNNGSDFVDDTNVSALAIRYLNGVRFTDTTKYPVTIGANQKAVASAALELISTTQGFLPTRTHATSNIGSPARGLMTYVTASATEGLYLYNSGSTPGWQKVITDAVTGSMTVVSASYALTASYVNPLVQDVLVTGSVYVSQSIYSGNKAVLGNNGNNGYLAFTQNGSNEISSAQYLYITKTGASGFLQIRSWNFVDIDSSLGVGLNSVTPSAQLHVKGSGTTSSTTALLVENSGATASLAVYDNNATLVTGRFGVNSYSNNSFSYFTSTVTNPSIPYVTIEGYAVASSPLLVLKQINTAGNSNLIEGYHFNATTQSFYLADSGNAYFRGTVGIGNSSPSYKLDVSGSGNFTSNLTVTGSLLVSGSTTGIRVGNTSRTELSPTSSVNLVVYSDTQDIPGRVTIGGSAAAGPTLNGVLSFSNLTLTAYGSSSFEQAKVESWYAPAGSTGGDLRFYTREFSTLDERMRIGYNGNIQIGTTTDAGFKLDVNGTGRFSGNVQITGSATNSLLVKGSGATSSTTALLVQNSSATASLSVLDDGTATIRNGLTVSGGGTTINATTTEIRLQKNGTSFVYINNDEFGCYFTG